MSFIVPSEFEQWCREVETSLARREAQRVQDVRDARGGPDNAAWRDRRPIRLGHAQSYLRWLHRADAAGVRARLAAAAGSSLRLYGPIYRSGVPTCGGSGSWWLDALLTGRPGLLARHRCNPFQQRLQRNIFHQLKTCLVQRNQAFSQLLTC